MIDVFKGLNEQQKKAVAAIDGIYKVVAGAGSGKTRVIVHRYAHLVNDLGIDPGNILCTTFTNKAAQEMRFRISKMVAPGNTNDFVCTIHGFCVKVLRRDIYRLGFPESFSIMDEADSEHLAKLVLDAHGLDRTRKSVRKLLKDVDYYKRLGCRDYINQYMLPNSPNGRRTKDFSPVETFINYQTLNYTLDFQDLIKFAIYILYSFDDSREYWQEKLNYIMVDETQDLNKNDWHLINIISNLYNNLFIVGDPDQAIYEWRYASPSIFVNYPCDEQIILNQNYRSTPNILDVANCIITNNKERIPKDLFTTKPPAEAVTHFHGKSEKEEAEWIVSKINKLVKEKHTYSDFAILYRASHLSRPIEQALLRDKVPYVIWGGIRFFERKEIKDALSYLKLIAHDDNLAFSRIVNVPSRSFGKVSLDKIIDLANSQGCSYYIALKNNIHIWHNTKAHKHLRHFISLIDECREYKDLFSISELTNYVLKESGLTDFYRNDPEEDRLENIEELVSSIRNYETVHEDDDISLDKYLQDISLYTNADYKVSGKTVRLMTVHQSKGLEFPIVFVCGLSEGIFPSHRALRDRGESALEEERRLMYVAVTRAEELLFLTESEGYNFVSHTDKFPSRFLTEIKKELLIQEGKIEDALWEGSKMLADAIDTECQIKTTEFTPFIGMRVTHQYFGIGEIVFVGEDKMRVKVQFGSDARSIRSLLVSSIKPEA